MPIVRTDRTRLKPIPPDDSADAGRHDDSPPLDDLWVNVRGGWRRLRIDQRDDDGPEPFEYRAV